MRLTTKGRYAVTALLDLAIHHEDGAVALADISARQCISLAYLEQLFARLRRAGLVVSTRGPGGGYSLASDPYTVSVRRIIDAIDEGIDATRCGGNMNCAQDQVCLTHFLWDDLSALIRTFLDERTLGELACQPHVREVAGRQRRRVEVAFPEAPARSSGARHDA